MSLGKGLMFVPVLASCCRLVAVYAADEKESPADSNRRDRWPVWDGDRVAVEKKKYSSVLLIPDFLPSKRYLSVSQTHNSQYFAKVRKKKDSIFNITYRYQSSLNHLKHIIATMNSSNICTIHDSCTLKTCFLGSAHP